MEYQCAMFKMGQEPTVGDKIGLVSHFQGLNGPLGKSGIMTVQEVKPWMWMGKQEKWSVYGTITEMLTPGAIKHEEALTLAKARCEVVTGNFGGAGNWTPQEVK